jgi:hypothetical protein
MSGVSDVRHVLVLPDRDAAEEVVEALRERFGVVEEPQLVRDALAGEDDAEDAQWLVVLRDEDGRLDAGELDGLAGEWEGWREEPEGSPTCARGRSRSGSWSCARAVRRRRTSGVPSGPVVSGTWDAWRDGQEDCE